MIKDNEKKVLITMRLDAGIKRQLARFAEAADLSQSEIAIAAVQEYMNEHCEDYTGMRGRLADLLAGEAKGDE